ncbi:unnamed protein product, partial [Symbiodinium natans]
ARRRGSALVRTPERWIPVPTTPSTPSSSPHKGWQEIQRLRGRSADHIDVQGCTALVRTLKRALRPGYMTQGRAPASFWRKAVKRGGNLAGLMRPEEIAEVRA